MIKFKIILILTALAIITAIPAMAQISNGDDDVSATTVDAGSSSTLGNISNGGDDDVSGGNTGGDTGGTVGDVTNGDDDTAGGNTGGNTGNTEGNITNGGDDVTGGNTGGDTGNTDGDITNGDDDTTGGNTGGDTGNTDGDITNGDDDTTGDNTGGNTGGDVTNGDDDVNNGGNTENNGGGTTNPSNTSRRSGGGSRNRNTIALENTGNVNTISTINASCPLITTYMRRGGNNDAVEVAKLQMFLRNEGITVPVTGIFDANTETAVNIFQKKYQTSVLGPWDASIPSGMVYITTKNKINEIACNQKSVLTPEQLTIIAQFIKNRDQGSNIIPASSLEFGVSTTTNDANLASDNLNDDNNGNTAAAQNASFIKRFWRFLTGIFR